MDAQAQQAIDITNEEAMDKQLRIGAQTRGTQEKLEEEKILVAKIERQIASYIQDINIKILGLKSSGRSASSPTITTGCQGIKTGNGCQLIPNNSGKVDNSVKGSVIAQLAQRRNELVVIQNRLKEKGSDGITENDKKFLNSLGISW